ncbi:MAG: NAD-dependent epimerase/dehydratase family protein [Nitrospirae bacterium]|nr:NAD-dependent epimerase/dehydratase family protein [Nitrospirota bacterium]
MLARDLIAEDLDHVLVHTRDLWEEIRGKRLFITGGTGFFGTWLLESFAWANEKLDLDASALVLTRDREAFAKQAPHLAASPFIKFHPGDIRDFTFPEGEFSHIIHAAATSAVATFNKEDPLAKFDTVVNGTRHALDFGVRCRAGKFLLTSSGAVYGKQPPGLTHVPEDYNGAPDTAFSNAAWGEAKRAAELLCACYTESFGLETKIARCFSFVGPYLQLDIHYAVGNFIRDALSGGPIKVNGDGTPCRSYLYAADLAIWLWTILFKGESRRAYNVGSEESITIAELADVVSKSFSRPVGIEILKSPAADSLPDRYVPSTRRALLELGLKQSVGLEEAIRRTIEFAKGTHRHSQS